MPLLARYDLAAARAWKHESLAGREPTMWRYRELMPLFDGEQPLSLGEGWTPLIHAQAARQRTRPRSRLFVKDESLNPTNSFKARGLSAAVTRASHPRREDAVDSDGRQRRQRDGRLRRRGRASTAKVFMPNDVKMPFIRECELYGADVTLVDGLITDAGRIAAETGKPLGWYDVSTLKEPYRIEGKKTMGYELGEQLDWTLPDWIIYPTGGGTGMVGMWKAFEEMEALGWIDAGHAAAHGHGAGRELRADRARVRRGHRERSEMFANARTVADGLRVPKAIGDFLVLRAVRESGGTALAVTDADMVARHARARRERRHQRGARRRRGPARAAGPARARRHQAAPTPSSSSTPAARSSISTSSPLPPEGGNYRMREKPRRSFSFSADSA